MSAEDPKSSAGAPPSQLGEATQVEPGSIQPGRIEPGPIEPGHIEPGPSEQGLGEQGLGEQGLGEKGLGAAPVGGANAAPPLPADTLFADATQTPLAEGPDEAEAAAAEETSPALQEAAADPAPEPAAAEAADPGGAAPAADDAAKQDASKQDVAKDAARIRALFTRRSNAPQDDAAAATPDASDEAFFFARWTRPIAPAFFGLSESAAEEMRAGFERAAAAASLDLAEQDPELGANLLVFVCETWSDLRSAGALERLIPELPALTTMLAVTGANQYRVFRVNEADGVRLAIVLLRMDETLSSLPPRALALGQAAQTLLLWSDGAFADEGPVTVGRHGRGQIKRWHHRLIEAAYGDDVPAVSRDPALAEALAEAIGRRASRPRTAAARRPGGARRGRRSAKDAETPTADSPTPASQAAETPAAESAADRVAPSADAS